jgi:hypothetical protein
VACFVYIYIYIYIMVLVRDTNVVEYEQNQRKATGLYLRKYITMHAPQSDHYANGNETLVHKRQGIS